MILRLGKSTFAIFDSFRDEAGRQAHLNVLVVQQAAFSRAPAFLGR
jgi:hypothetical protein